MAFCFHRQAVQRHFSGCVIAILLANFSNAQTTSINLWPGTTPGENAAQGDESDTSQPDKGLVAGKSVIRLGNVSKPMLTVYPAPVENNTGASVIVCPGGGYHILAYDLEGTEVCEWLQSIGVTGLLLKYRVPKPASDQRAPIEPLQDVQRAFGLARAHAAEWKIDPTRIGVLGFSAGGHLSARISTNYAQRVYDAVDSSDQLSCRPDFTILIYPAYLFEPNSAADQLVSPSLPVNAETPPMFLTMAFDDRVGPENILRMGLALKKHEVPAEVHLYPTGGHGYGLRRTEHHATAWPDHCAKWMQSSGFLTADK